MGWLTNKIRKVMNEENNGSTYKARFNYMKDELNVLNDRIDALYQLTSKEYVFINQTYNTYYGDKTLNPTEARKYFKDLGYDYVTNYNRLGELWVKEKINV